jgi:hypothetical protein
VRFRIALVLMPLGDRRLRLRSIRGAVALTLAGGEPALA